MPPAVSNERGSDREEIERLTPKKLARSRNSTSYNESNPEDENPRGETNEHAGEVDKQEEEDGEELEEEVYVVEKILSHMFDKGKPLFEVKWEGYEKKSDRTWEPEENLIENASEALNEYLDSIGGREKMYEESANALKTKKRGRQSSSATPQKGGKRSRVNGDHPADSEPPSSAKAAVWKPPAGSWEDHIAHLDACEDEETRKLMVYLTWKNGQKTQHPTHVIYQRCPQRMLQFYEQHIRIVKREPSE
ncbi:hypothetical protein VTI28DRAFT_9772 [Corynascus sepedonium]